MKVYRIEICIVDHDDIGAQEIKDVIEHTRYPNHCISPEVMKAESVDIGEWRDSHPLNDIRTFERAYQETFSNPHIIIREELNP